MENSHATLADSAQHSNVDISTEQQDTEHANHDATSKAPTASLLSWAETDATHLLATNIPLARAPRAWDRKPQSPFSRKRLKVGKVWKRTNMVSTVVPSGPSAKRRVSPSPSKKAVKKIRLDKGASIGVGVNWEGLSNPERRIVTRASRLAELDPAPLIVLAEDGVAQTGEESQDHFYVDTTRESIPEMTVGGWEDIDLNLEEEELQVAITTGEEVVEVVYQQDVAKVDPTGPAPAHLTVAINPSALLEDSEHQARELNSSISGGREIDDTRFDDRDEVADPSSKAFLLEPSASLTEAAANARSISNATAGNDEIEETPRDREAPGQNSSERVDTQAEAATPCDQEHNENTAITFAMLAQTPVLPAGFATPVKDRRRRPVREARRSLAARRRTLPVDFTADDSNPQSTTNVPDAEPAAVQKATSPPPNHGGTSEATTVTSSIDTVIDPTVEHSDMVIENDSGEWEDIVDSADENPQSDLDSDETGTQSTNGLDPKAVLSEVETLRTTPDQSHRMSTTGQDAGVVDLELITHREGEIEAERAFTPSDQVSACVVLPSGQQGQHPVESPRIAQDIMLVNVSQDALEAPAHVDNDAHIQQQDLEEPLNQSTALLRARRQSSSPRKSRSTTSSHHHLPHLVAFTPIKLNNQLALDNRMEENESAALESVEYDHDQPTSCYGDDLISPSDIESLAAGAEKSSPSAMRSLSAPPEPAQASPRKSRQPRISDDTALLQAFLSRAAESKSKAERRMSASKRESLENRRDSDSIRFALASSPVVPQFQEKEADPEVLKILDPNSPSPRKQQAIVNKAIKSEQPKALPQPHLPTEETENTVVDEVQPESRNKRRSTRPRKQTQVLDTSERTAAADLSSSTFGPNKISIRPFGSDPVVWKRPEAQEIALLTRTNTRKNKGALNPQQRLTKLAAEEAGLVQTEGTDIVSLAADPPKIKAKNVRWAETLALFQAGPVVIDEAVMIEVGEPAPTTVLTDSNISDEVVSKPYIKKLKPRLTPRAPINTETIDELADESDVVTGPLAFNLPEASSTSTSEEKEKSKLKRRTRIATPAKVKVGTKSSSSKVDDKSALPERATAAASAPAPTTEDANPAPIPAPRRSLISKLPAPVPSTSAISTLAHPGRERETSSLIASPPKKKMRMRSSARQQQQPPLQPNEPTATLFPTATSSGLKPPSSASFGFTGAAVPKLEALSSSKSASLAASADTTLMLVSSPAKKAPRLFPMGSTSTHTVGGARGRELEAMKGMGSPAKKRGRRA